MAVFMFWFAAIMALLGALGVVISREPLRSVLSLVIVMISLSIEFVLLSAEFLFAVQIIVYAGAVMVLFLFVVALIGPIREGPDTRLRLQSYLGLLVAAALIGLLYAIFQGSSLRAPGDADPSLMGTVEAIGRGLFTTYLYPFELTSLLLLVAAVGAIYLSRREQDQ